MSEARQTYFNPEFNRDQFQTELKQYESIRSGYHEYGKLLDGKGDDAGSYDAIYSMIDRLEFLKLKSICLSYITSIGKQIDIYFWRDKNADELREALKEIVSCLPANYLNYCWKQIEFENNFHIDQILLDFIINDSKALLFVANAMCYYLPSYRKYAGLKNLRDDIVEHLRFSAFFRVEGFRVPLYKNTEITNTMLAPRVKVLYDSHSAYPIKTIYENNLTEKKWISWINKNDREQLDYILKYLENNKLLCMNGKFTPLSNEEKYLLILASLDSLSNLENPDIRKKSPRNPRGKNSSKPVQLATTPKVKNEVFSDRSIWLFRLRNSWDAKKRRMKNSQKTKDHFVKILKNDKPKLDALMEILKLSETKLISKMLEVFYIVHGQDKK